jgi:hypothetical protein
LKSLVFVVVILFLCSCAVGGGRTSVGRDKDFEFSMTEKLKPGMPVSEIVALLGRPSAYGRDDAGRDYLRYNLQHFSSTTGSVSVGIVSGVKNSSRLKGFELLVQVDEGKLVTYGWTIYPDD